MRRNFSRHLLASALVSFSLMLGLCVVPAWGQMGTQGTISVTVVDPTGAVVPEANLTLQDLRTNDVRTAVTQVAGTFTFSNLNLGTYKLTVAKDGFQTQVFDSITVQATRVTDVRVTLIVGAVATEVVVSERAVPVMETSSNAISGTVDLKQIEQLPMTGRDISQLAFLVPGFAGARGTGGTWNGLPLIATGSNIDGVQANTNRMKFGGNTTPAVSARVEDIEEMTVQTDMLNLNTGFGSTGMQVNYVTRRGSNAFHGRAYWDHRNDNLNANTWVNNAVGNDRAEFKLNDFGGSVGGPVVRDKLFFFGSFAMSKQPGADTVDNDFINQTAQDGTFTYTDLSTGNPVTINLLTDVAGSAAGQAAGLSTTVNSDTQAAFSDINGSLSYGAVTATSTDFIDSIVWLNYQPVTTYFPAARVDYNVTDTLRMNFAFNNTKTDQPFVNAPPFPGPNFANRVGSNRSNRWTGSVGIDWSLTPTVINQFRGGFLYYYYLYGDAEPLWLTQPRVNWPVGNSGLTYPGTNSRYFPLFNFADNVTFQKGSHTLNFGVSYYRERDHYWNPPTAMGVDVGMDAADPAFTVFENYFGANASETDKENARDLYSVLTGRLTSVDGTYPLDPATEEYIPAFGQAFKLNELSQAWALFVQDAWRLSPSLTFNYGLRWDFTGDQHDLNGAYHSADEAHIYGPTCAGCIFQPGTSSLTGFVDPVLPARVHAYKPWNVSPQPAVGIAWNPNYTDGFMGSLFGGNTVIRVGASLRKFTPPYQYFWNAGSNMGYAFYQTYSLSPSTGGEPGTFQPGTLTVSDVPDTLPAFRLSPSVYQANIPQSEETFFGYWGGVNGILEDIKQPYVMSWNIGIQRAFGTSNVLEVRYIGNRSIHQWVTNAINEINIVENGFLSEFEDAQANLAINEANGMSGTFANNGFAGQVDTPILTDAGIAPDNGSFINYLTNGLAGNAAEYITDRPANLCPMIGSVNFSPCEDTVGVGVAGAYPINFFQANPFNSGKGGELMTDRGWGNYHALQVDWRQKYWHGMQFNVNYTWSHTLGVQPGNSWTGGFDMFTMRDIRLNYGPTLYDFRHILHANGTYDLPFGQGKRYANAGGVVDKIVGGWSVGTIVTYQTGAPYQLRSRYNTYNGPSGLPISGAYGDSGVWLNTDLSAIQDSVGVYYTDQTTAYTIGSAFVDSGGGSNTSMIVSNTTAGENGGHFWLSGPNRFFQDLAITKVIPITERWRINFQSQFLNVWNHPVWGSPTRDIRSNSFGRSSVMRSFSNALGERQIEFRLNIEF